MLLYRFLFFVLNYLERVPYVPKVPWAVAVRSVRAVGSVEQYITLWDLFGTKRKKDTDIFE